MRKRISAALVSSVVLSLFAIVIDASDNYTVNHGANLAITAHTACRNVVNSSATGTSVYVPTETDAEWQSFYTNPPAGVTAGACSCTLPWGDTLSEGQSATAYQSPSVSSGSCVSQARSCMNGALSGTYEHESCYVNLTVTAGTNKNLCTIAGNPTVAGHYRFTIASGIVIYSGSTASPALTTGTCWRTGSTIIIINNGRIYGMGGNGSAGSNAPTAAGAGGNAMTLSYPVTIDNTNGYIFGGGGGGGGGSRGYNAYAAAGGGGGASGTTASSGGAGQSTLQRTGQAGGAGNTSGAGAGGAGGAAGKAIDTNGHAVTWLDGNTSARVKGAVSN